MKLLLTLILMFSSLTIFANDSYLRVEDGKRRQFKVVAGDGKAVSKLEDLFKDAYNAKEVEDFLCYEGDLELAIDEANRSLAGKYDRYRISYSNSNTSFNAIVFYDDAEEFLLSLESCSKK